MADGLDDELHQVVTLADQHRDKEVALERRGGGGEEGKGREGGEGEREMKEYRKGGKREDERSGEKGWERGMSEYKCTITSLPVYFTGFNYHSVTFQVAR